MCFQRSPLSRRFFVYLGFSRFRLFSFSLLSFCFVLWFRQRIHLLFDQVDYYRVCKISGNIKAVLLCTEIKSSQSNNSSSN